MVRRVVVLGLSFGVLGGVGCRHRCSEPYWRTSAVAGPQVQMVSQPGGCCDGVAGVPVSGGGFAPGMPATLVPGAAQPYSAPPTNALPYPQPSDLIPRPGVPVPSAVPTPAPPSGELGASVLPPPKFGVPVKNTK